MKRLFSSLNSPSLQQLQPETTQPKEYRLSGRGGVGMGGGGGMCDLYLSQPTVFTQKKLIRWRSLIEQSREAVKGGRGSSAFLETKT